MTVQKAISIHIFLVLLYLANIGDYWLRLYVDLVKIVRYLLNVFTLKFVHNHD